MAKVQFSTSVKYNGKLIPPFTPFEVSDTDFEMVVKSGGHILERPKKTDSDEVTNEKTDINQESTKEENSPRRARRSRR